jgi:putative endopeptidase
MVKTKRHKFQGEINRQNSKTKKWNPDCPIGLQPFEEEFSKKMSPESLRISNREKSKEFVKELMTKFAPSQITPQDDFYSYINYIWLENVSVNEQQKYFTQVDDFRLVQDKVYTQLNDIILQYIKTHNNPLAQNMKNFYNSVINMNSKNETRQLSKEVVQLIDNYTSHDSNVWKLLAYINKDEMIAHSAPFVWSLNPDDKNSKVFRCYITPHQFAILDINVYFDDGKDVDYKKKYRKAFIHANQQIFDTLLGEGHSFNAQDIYDVELEIFDTLGCIDITSKEEDQYNKVTISDSIQKYGFDWSQFAKELGFVNTPDFFITSSLNYLKCGTDLLLKKWNSPKWKTYWVWILLRRLARITRDWEKLNYKFSGEFERGQEAINRSDAVSASLYMSVPFNTFLTKAYVEKYENPQAIEFVKTLCHDLKLVFMRIIQRNTWMEPSTRKYALLKLKHLQFTIAKPEKLREDPLLNYGSSLYINMKKIINWRHKRFIHLEGKKVIDIPQMDWSQYPVKMSGTQAYIVNASYTPAKNGIYINLGYIQKPFIDLEERGIEYNLAHIGYTISHELGHVLDDWGSTYDYKGNLHDWWTKEDKAKFKAIQKDVIQQYEQFAKRDGIDFDASIGIGEDMADITAMSICTEYLRDFQEKNNDLIPIRYLSFEVFYTYFAFQQRQIVKKKALSAQLKTNPHPLNKYRCNIPLTRSEIFRAIYNVQRNNKMWWKNTDKCW